MVNGVADEPKGSWTYLTNHTHVLICLARNPDLRIRDLAAEVGITERSVLAIVSDLEEAGCLRRHREGRRNRYEVIGNRPMRHQVEQGHDIGEILDVLVSPGAEGRRPAAGRPESAGRSG